MTQFYAPQLGRLEPSPEKVHQNGLYSIGDLPEFVVPAKIEKVLDYPDYVDWYNQRKRNACTGFASSWAATICNQLDETPPPKYDAVWLYHQGQLIDDDPRTDPDHDIGGYIWACMDVLKKKGHRKVVNNITLDADLIHGIESYYWAHTIDDLRSAIYADRPVVFGVPWYDEFSNPVRVNNEWWIGRNVNWNARPVGGHAICGFGVSDMRDAAMWINSWGPTFPPVWIPYSTIEKLMARQGEMCVPLDYKPTPPIPTSPSASVSPSASNSPSRSASASMSTSASMSASASQPDPETERAAVDVATQDGKRYVGFIERIK